MELAYEEALKAYKKNEIPVGAIIELNGEVISKGHNLSISEPDPTAHAEIIAITAAASFLEDWRLEECTLYVTKEPCAMCAGAIINSRLEKVVFGCYDEKEGCCGSLYQICSDPRFSHKTAVKGGVLQDDCNSLLVNFFKNRR